MTWNDWWETKLFLGGQGTARWYGSEINNIVTPQNVIIAAKCNINAKCNKNRRKM